MYCAFVDLEKAYDRVPRDVVFCFFKKGGVHERLEKIVEDMYTRETTRVRTEVGITGEFEVKVGLCQGSALKPLLFVLVAGVHCESIAKEELWELLFADDLGLMAESKELQTRNKRTQQTLAHPSNISFENPSNTDNFKNCRKDKSSLL